MSLPDVIRALGRAGNDAVKRDSPAALRALIHSFNAQIEAARDEGMDAQDVGELLDLFAATVLGVRATLPPHYPRDAHGAIEEMEAFRNRGRQTT